MQIKHVAPSALKRSGNPYGRPKGALNSLTKAINKTLSQGIEVTDANGRIQRMTMIEVTWRRLIDSAAAGDLKAIAEVLELCCAIERSDRPATKPREISSRSASVKASRDRRRGGG